MSEAAGNRDTIQLFFSYSHKDQDLRDSLEEHLAVLKREGAICGWHDREVLPGAEWEVQISKHLERADVVLLLVSASFVDSDHCNNEMRMAMDRHTSGQATVVPILLRRVANWQSAEFAKLQSLPANGNPVSEWKDQDKALADIASGLRKVIDQLRERRVFHNVDPAQDSSVETCGGEDPNVQSLVQRTLRRNDLFKIDPSMPSSSCEELNVDIGFFSVCIPGLAPCDGPVFFGCSSAVVHVRLKGCECREDPWVAPLPNNTGEALILFGTGEEPSLRLRAKQTCILEGRGRIHYSIQRTDNGDLAATIRLRPEWFRPDGEEWSRLNSSAKIVVNTFIKKQVGEVAGESFIRKFTQKERG